MPKPCSLELRERVVDAVKSGASRREAADWFDVSPSSAIKWMQRRQATGSIAAKPSGGSVSPLEAHAAFLFAPEFGYRETSDPDDADRRNFYKVEKWDAAELRVEALLHASNDLGRAQAVFATEKKHRPRGRYLLRQNIRVLDRWPPHGA